MKAKLIAVVSAIVAAVAAIVLAASLAAAGIGTPTTPYPPVPINPKVCKTDAIKVAQAQLKYDQALTNYKRVLKLFDRRAASAQELRNARQALDESVIALDNAKYAEATCQNNAANPKDKNCVNLALELNRLLDELPVTQDMEAIAKTNFDVAKRLLAQHAISHEEYEKIKAAYENAKLQTQLVEQEITDQKEKVAKAGCKNAERPSPTPTPTPSVSPTPTPSRTPTPTPSPTSPRPTPTPTSPSPRPTPTPPTTGIIFIPVGS